MRYRVGDTCLTKSCIMHNKNVSVYYSKYINNNNNNNNSDNNNNYYIRLYFTVFLLARSNTRDIPFSNILISKKQFLCNKKAYCTLVQNQ